MYVSALLLAYVASAAGVQDANVFPGAAWEQRNPADVGLDAAKLDELAERLGGRGCVVKNGYIVKTWGDQTKRGDWASSAKPVLSTMLFFAVEEGLVKGVDQRIADFGWQLREKDRTMTFRHLGGMISGYARPEPPGAAWAYNDYAIQLYQKTLFDKVFKQDPKVVCEDPNRLGALHLQDGLKFSERRRISASVRDWARIAWFWLNRGRWGDRQVLPRRYFDEYMKPQVPKDLAISRDAPTEDYLRIGTYGGESSHFSQCGPGAYGFNWWFNSTGQRHRESLTWPDAPPDTVYTSGVRGNCSVMMPSLNLVVACAEGRWGELEPGDPTSRLNKVLKLAATAAGYRSEARAFVCGAMKKWHSVAVSFTGPTVSEEGQPNPFTDYRLDVTFERGDRKVIVPGFFAADGNPAETGASSGRVWRARFLPDREGTWTYSARFREGPGVAVADDAEAGRPVAFDGMRGSFAVGPADQSAPGFLAKGLLEYRGERYLRFAETGEYFIKGGADSPENFLAFADFDQTPPTHKYEPHAADWRPGDPTWHQTRGKNIVGALNYLASKRMNSVYFLTMNVNGDGKDVWPWTSQDEQRRFDCSKLDQWEIVFAHMDRLGLMLHVVHQEQENDHLIDGGELGPARRLYYRELIARFAHHPALVWNLGEENRNTDAQRKAFARYVRDLDPYKHPIVVHTFPSQIERVYAPLLGCPYLDGPSLQLGKMTRTHEETLTWIRRSAEAGHPWFVCLDEIGPANVCVGPDAEAPGHEDVVRHALWGNLIAGGAGCEWIFAYNTWPRKEHAPHQDTHCEDWRPWDRMWDLTSIAMDFFHRYLPFPEMKADDMLVEPQDKVWCLAKPGQVYAVYVWGGTDAKLDLPAGAFLVEWYDPRKGGSLTAGASLTGPGKRAIGRPPADAEKDWVARIRRKPASSAKASAEVWPDLPRTDGTAMLPAQEWPFAPGPRQVKAYVYYPGGSLSNVKPTTGLMLSLHNWGGTGHIGTADPGFLTERYDLVAICVDYLQSGKYEPNVPYDFGYLQALDAVRALYWAFDGLERLGRPFARGRVFAAGGSGGGNVALMANKLAPRTFACIIDCSGMARLSDEIAFNRLGGKHLNAGYSQDPGSAFYLSKDAQELRFVGHPGHLAAMKMLGNVCKVIVSHGSSDSMCSVEDAREMVANMLAAGVDVEAHFITEVDIDGKAVKDTGHAVGDRTLIVNRFAGQYLSPAGPKSLLRRGKCDFELRDDKVRYTTTNGTWIISYEDGYPSGRFEPAARERGTRVRTSLKLSSTSP